MTENRDGKEIRCIALQKSFMQGRECLQILNNIDLEIRKGQSVAILGSSGSGKTTLLQLLAGLDRPDGGVVSIHGVDIHRLSETQRCSFRNLHMGFVFQFHHLLHDFSALENVLMPWKIRRQVGKTEMDRAIYLLEQVGLTHRLKHRPAQLSGGERQRVAVARALVTEPDFVLADEPTGNLDQKMAHNVQDLILDLQKNMGFSLMVVTHDELFANRLDRVLLLENARLIEHYG
ncbi:MAG: ABC transporter ATP-binding protein [Gammaproteobacteria bacterium]|nr:MAG: ABC transporter ATP-binding protein [Gammaproteobacteria bacterium]